MNFDELQSRVEPLLDDVGFIFPHHWNPGDRIAASVYCKFAAKQLPELVQALRLLQQRSNEFTCADRERIIGEALAFTQEILNQ